MMDEETKEAIRAEVKVAVRDEYRRVSVRSVLRDEYRKLLVEAYRRLVMLDEHTWDRDKKKWVKVRQIEEGRGAIHDVFHWIDTFNEAMEATGPVTNEERVTMFREAGIKMSVAGGDDP